MSNAGSEEEIIDLLEVARVLRSNLRKIIAVPLVVGPLTLGITFLIPPTFTANTIVMPPAQQSSSALSAIAGQLGGLGGLAGAAGIKSPADQYIAFLRSRNVSDHIITQFDLKNLYDLEFQQDTRNELAKRVRVVAGKKDGLITIEVDDRDPKRAADIANAYVEQLRRINTEFAVGEASQRRAFFETQLEQAKAGLASAEDALNASGVSSSSLNAAPQAAVAAVAKLKGSVTAQEVRIASMQGFVTEDNPDLKQARLELSALRAQLKQLEAGTPVVDGDRGRYLERYRTFKYQETLFELMAKQYEMARLDEAREGTVIQVLDVAVPPERKSHPKKMLITFVACVVSLTTAALFFALYNLWWLRMSSAPSMEVEPHQRAGSGR